MQAGKEEVVPPDMRRLYTRRAGRNPLLLTGPRPSGQE